MRKPRHERIPRAAGVLQSAIVPVRGCRRRRMVRVLRAAGTSVLWARPPCWPRLGKWKIELGGCGAYENIVTMPQRQACHMVARWYSGVEPSVVFIRWTGQQRMHRHPPAVVARQYVQRHNLLRSYAAVAVCTAHPRPPNVNAVCVLFISIIMTDNLELVWKK